MTLNTKHAARMFALTFFAILTLMMAVSVLIAMNCRNAREINHVEDLQADQRKDIGSLQAEGGWFHAAVQQIRDEKSGRKTKAEAFPKITCSDGASLECTGKSDVTYVSHAACDIEKASHVKQQKTKAKK